ncbi:MAG TPA: hypothetical protein PK323_13190 [Bacteroidia bacterium]|nr:hypothetical protein [Bacteroidia bacterium]
MFKNRNLVIATKHQKEAVIAPLFEKEFGVKCIVPANINTDLLGTFSGEIERENDALTTIRTKCLMGMNMLQCDLGIASEGSFGMHPSAFFLPANNELMMFIDSKNNLEITASVLSTETNFNAREIHTLIELDEFCEQTMFPEHALILKDKKDNFSRLEKDLNTYEKLVPMFEEFVKLYGKAYVETDMRAMYNPSRMKVIAQVSQKLIENIKSNCPVCSTPGFIINKNIPGLPCELCLNPTYEILGVEYLCKKCFYTSITNYPDGKKFSDPGRCNFCNP